MERKHPNEEFDIAIALQYKKKCSFNNKISYRDIYLTEQAQITIGNAILSISTELDISSDILTKSITENLFNVNDELILLIDIPDYELENIITIPKGYWGYKKDLKETSKITYH